MMDPLHYYPQYRVLVCKSCQYAIQPGRIIAHLHSKQHKLSKPQAEEVADRYKDKELADPCTQRIVPESTVQPIKHLPIHRDGLACHHCQFICRSKNWMQRHRREVHNIKVGRGRRSDLVGWSDTWCQCFFISAGQHYFKVQQTNQQSTQQLIQQPNDTSTQRLQLVHRQLDQKEKIIEQKKQAIRDSDDPTEVSSWLERTQWIRHLEGQDRGIIVKLIGVASNEELEIQYLEKSLNRLIEKARQTILQKKISTFTLHRVQSFQSGEDSHKPFHVNLGSDTIERYQRVWSKLLIYILRTARSDIQLYQLTQEQQYRVEDVLIAADRAIQFDGEELEEEEKELIERELDWSCL
jgi:putative sterol carrier protein